MAKLEIVGLEAGYGKARVVQGVSLQVREKKITLIVGSNGSGKSTLVKAIAGLITPLGGKVLLDGKDITGLRAEDAIREGIALVPEGGHLFSGMSVRENLLMGGVSVKNFRANEGINEVGALFPILKERSRQIAGTLSGGEQHMLAIARALICRAGILILDEPSAGVAPLLTERIFKKIVGLKEKGTTVLLIEQNASAIEIADYLYVMKTGRIVAQGKPSEILSRENVKRLFLG